MPQLLLTLEKVFIILDVTIATLLVFAIVKGLHFRPDLNPRKKVRGMRLTLSGPLFEKRLAEMRRKISSGSPELQRIAILDAENLVDEALHQLGVEGERMIDRIRELFRLGFLTADRLERAHRIRNELVYSPDYELTPDIAERTFNDYESFLRETAGREITSEEKEEKWESIVSVVREHASHAEPRE